MGDVSRKIKSIDLAGLVRDVGVKLRSSGGRHVGLCPFHSEKTPSFFVFPDNCFKCFSCQERGDAVDFVRRLHGLNFVDALRYLGIDYKPISGSQLKAINKSKRARERREIIERAITYTLATEIRRMNSALLAITPETTDEASRIYHKLPQFEYYHDVLLRGADSDRAIVLQGLQNLKFIERNQIFHKNFDFPMWLRGFVTEQKHNGEKSKRNH